MAADYIEEVWTNTRRALTLRAIRASLVHCLSKVRLHTSFLDGALDFAVAPGYASIGYRLRGLSWESAVAGSLRGRAASSPAPARGSARRRPRGLREPGPACTWSSATASAASGPRAGRAATRVERRPGAAAARALRPLRARFGPHASPPTSRARAGDRRARQQRRRAARSRRRNSAGVELTFATNVLGPFALTELLLPALRAEVPGRVVNVSSGGMYTARLDADDLQLDRRYFDGPPSTRTPSAPRSCSTSCGREREGERGVVFASMHPGWADTPGLRAVAAPLSLGRPPAPPRRAPRAPTRSSGSPPRRPSASRAGSSGTTGGPARPTGSRARGSPHRTAGCSGRPARSPPHPTVDRNIERKENRWPATRQR